MDKQVPKNFIAEPYPYHYELELIVDSLTNLGSGICRATDGWVVMVPFVIPGERVRARIYRNHSNYSEADLVEVLDRSPDRVDPACRLFQTCGGCQYQHIEYGRQLEEKTARVVELMEKAGLGEHRVEPAVGSPQLYHYRSKITPHYERPARDGSQPIGFLQHGRRRTIVDVESCPIATQAINEVLPGARAEARESGGKKRRQRGGTLLLRHVLEGVVTDPKAVVSERVGGLTFQFRAGEFFQNNPYILPQMVDYVIGEAKFGGVQYLVDAYCGSGLFALSAASSFTQVAGVEVSDQAVLWAQANCRISRIENARFLIGKAEAIFKGLSFLPEETTVIIDPPRKGCDASFRDQLMGYRPARVVYVSCNPATQTRDVEEFLQSGYRIERIQPFDLFPHTRHIENVITLVGPEENGSV
ncbi:MAG: class I SAM-dependent RNA methyltransferase [Coraliomargarita sp. TMED73]|nr:MAG: class I SAM-dependent RNA methyltransferase [Coraliomargarita sp. TMED73]